MNSLGSRGAIFLAMAMLFLIPFASALEFDNVKIYDPVKKEVTVKNNFGLGHVIAKIKLDTPLVHNVMRGENRKVAEYTINLYDPEYSSPIKELEIYDGTKKISRPISYKYKAFEDVIKDIPVYQEICKNIVGNNSEIIKSCDKSILNYSKQIVKREIWNDLNISKLENGTYTVGIFTTVLPGDYIEWIPNIMGTRVNEWAVWTESFDVGLVAYYKLNESGQSATALDNVFSSRNLTNIGSGFFMAGKIGNGFFVNDSHYLVNSTANYPFTINNFTVTLWANLSSTSVAGTFFNMGDYGNGATTGMALGVGSTTLDNVGNNLIGGPNQVAWDATGQAIGTGFHFIAMVLNNTHTFYYIDGVNVFNSTARPNALINAGIIIGRNYVAGGSQRPFNNIVDEVGIWNRTLTPSEINDLYNTGTGLTYLAPTPSAVTTTLISPTNAFNTKVNSITFSANATFVGTGNLTNMTLHIWSPTLTRNITLGLTGTFNSSSWIMSGLADSNSIWNVLSCADNLTGSVCAYGANRTFTVDSTAPTLTIVSPTNNRNFYGAYNFTFNHTESDATTSINTCWYSFDGGINTTLASCANATIPFARTGNQTIIFSANDTLNNVASTSANFTLYPQLSLCNTTNNVAFANYSFLDELSLAKLNSTLDAGTSFNYWATTNGSSLNRTDTFSNSTHNPSYSFCVSPAWIPAMTISPTIKYASTQGAVYPQRTHSQTNGSYTNVTTNTTLYLLSSASGQYVTFQVVNVANTPLENVQVSVMTTISGSSVTIGNSFTDASGAAVFWLNPLASHTFTFQKSGYSTLTQAITPAATSYTVTLNSVGATNVTDPNNGVTYAIAPTASYLTNGTYYNFNLTLSSTLSTVTAWGYNLTNSSGFLFASNSSVANGGFLSSNITTGDNRTISMNGYYTISGTNYTFTRVWVINDLSGTGYSLSYFFSNLKTYVTSGMFGLDAFGLNLIIFLIIFTSAGIMSYSYGIYSPVAIAGIIFAETAFFDVALGLVTAPAFVAVVPNAATVFMGIIFLGLIIREATSY